MGVCMYKHTYSFTRSNCSFLGSMSSIYGSSFGYSSSTFERMARWALDLTLDLAPEVMLRRISDWISV
jgi:hypothetical protein